jgi:hypothetical protein
VKSENKKIENPEEQYRAAFNAEQHLFKAVDYSGYINRREEDRKIPFKKKPFKGITKKENTVQVSSSYKNPRIKNKKNNVFGIKPEIKEATPDEVRAYDLFSPIPEIGIIGKGRFDGMELD